MLVLSRQRGETVKIGSDVDITVVDVRGDKVRLGINAPRNVEVHRKEIYEAIHKQNVASAGLQPGDVPARTSKPQPAPLPAGMPARPETSALFTLWKDPESGIESYLLTQRIAPVQQALAASPFSNDGRFLWFSCAFPPGGSAHQGRTLGLVDFAEQQIHHFPETQFSADSPGVNGQTGEAWWCSGAGIFGRAPRADAKPDPINHLPERLYRGIQPTRLATQLILSADGRFLSFDAQVGMQWHIGAAPIDGSDVQVWQSFSRPHSHAQFSPSDPDLMLITQDQWIDPVTLEPAPAPEQRLWLLRRGQPAEPLTPGPDPAPRRHAWWQADGSHIWFTDCHAGAQRVNLRTRKVESIWIAGTGHSHCDAAGQYIVGDIGADRWQYGCRIAFHNTRTGKTVPIATNLPLPSIDPAAYAIAPRPHFCMNDRYICYTTTALGNVDVAVVPVERLVAATA